jgi:hypothetical protein
MYNIEQTIAYCQQHQEHRQREAENARLASLGKSPDGNTASDLARRAMSLTGNALIAVGTRLKPENDGPAVYLSQPARQE